MFREPRDKVVQDHRKVIMGLHAAFLNVIAAIRCLVLRREVKVPGHGLILVFKRNGRSEGLGHRSVLFLLRSRTEN